MLDTETKRKIDSARDILVGKIPDPKAQVEQITIALIYKFMDDMDKESEALGGHATFFTDTFAQYQWTKLFDRKLSGQGRLDLYVRAIENMSKNPNLPQLFRDIFKGAFLPFRDPQTLTLFIKEINEFNYDHSENLGNAFEYLLSVLGAQGDAGQFRTPRHIIDFIVRAVDPQKHETILDPACGTAGFLISAYKHILENHDGAKNHQQPLTPDERKKLMNNLVGYDISPDMVKLSLVNLFLHRFQTPKIHEYDTLTSEKYWHENFDVMLANPPFMTPKGGIRPHQRFSVRATRSEVLFVDYILEHLNFTGRAGIIVPEGIVFKTENAYKQLRKKLLEDGLFAVVSLPAGVFQPYSGVKTSILFFDNERARKTAEILFLKIENDGFDLGAQRRKIDKNNLPEALEIFRKWRAGKKQKSDLAVWAKKEKIAANDDLNLIGERYREVEMVGHQKWPMVELGEVLNYEQPTKYIVESVNYDNSYKTPVLTAGKAFILGYTNERDGVFPKEKLPVIIFDDFTTAIKFVDFPFKVKSSAMKILHPQKKKADVRFLFQVMKTIKFRHEEHKRYWISEYSKIKIPLPPLAVQKEIVAQIEVKQNAIFHAKEIIKNLERERRYFGRQIEKLKNIEMVALGEVAEVISGQSPESRFYNQMQEGLPFYQGKTEFTGMLVGEPKAWTRKVTKIAEKGDILMSVRAPVGPVNIATQKICIGRGIASIRPTKIERMFLFYFLKSKEDEIKGNGGAVFDSINRKQIEKIKIPLPPLAVQKQLVAEAEKEEAVITANKNLIERMERKIENVLTAVL